MITEVKPKNCRFKVGHADLHILDYEMFSTNFDCESGRGIAIYVHKSLQASQLDTDQPGEESLWLEVKLEHTDRLLVGCCYRSPNSTDENDTDLNSLLETMSSRSYTVYTPTF